MEAGTLLKNKRESLGLTQKQISDRLKLRVTLIQQIEENQFETDQVATFMRGYIRSYAKYVNLDQKVVLNALHHTGDAQHQEQEMLSFSRKTKTEKHNSRIMLLTWSIFAVIVGISSLVVVAEPTARHLIAIFSQYRKLGRASGRRVA